MSAGGHQGRDRVSKSWSLGNRGNSYLPAHSSVTVGHRSCALLVFRLDELKAVFTAKLADQIHIRVSHHTENGFSAFFVDRLCNCLVNFHGSSKIETNKSKRNTYQLREKVCHELVIVLAV